MVIACSTSDEAEKLFVEILDERNPSREGRLSAAHALRAEILFLAGHYDRETDRRVASLFSPLPERVS